MKNSHQQFKQLSLFIVWCWMFLFALLPFCLVVLASFMRHTDNQLIAFPATLENYQQAGQALYLRIFAKSFLIAGVTTCFCLLLGYPFAYLSHCAHAYALEKFFIVACHDSFLDQFLNSQLRIDRHFKNKRNTEFSIALAWHHPSSACNFIY
jgi:ABC-type spermidine/putrescine transport system permease subunit I